MRQKLQTSFQSWKRRPRFFKFFVPFLYIKRHQKTPQLRFLKKLPHDNTLYCASTIILLLFILALIPFCKKNGYFNHLHHPCDQVHPGRLWQGDKGKTGANANSNVLLFVCVGVYFYFMSCIFQCLLYNCDCRKEKEKIELPEGIKSKGPKKQVRPSPPLTRRNSEDKVSAHIELAQNHARLALNCLID